jgi:ERCC4-type nuclease
MPNHDSEAQETLQVCLVIDYREKPEFQTLLRQLGIAFWVRVLPTGDALWVARAPTSSPSAAEDPSTAALSDEHAYLLNVLVERKPIPDLIASIRDQRYRIQKARMRQSGLERLVYLIEGDTQPRRGESASDRIRLEQTILSAQLHTKMRDGFHIVRVANAVVTAQWYQQMTLQFQQRLRMGDRSMLVPCLNHTTTWLPLGVWRRDLQRQEQLLPLRAILCRQLQALPGIRERTALTILQCTGAGSAHELYEWFQEHASEAENVTKLSEESKYLRGNGLRSVPENVSALLWQLFT